jgi:phenolic acid decarboxylase
MKKIVFAILTMSIVFSCKHQEKKENLSLNDGKEISSDKLVNLSGKTLEYNYGEFVYVVNFKSDKELHWKCVKGAEKGREANENYTIQRLNTNSLFVSWVEQDGLGVSQVINLKNYTVNCFLKIDKEIIPLSGTIREF